MRLSLSMFAIAVIASGCAAQFRLVDRMDGQVYLGQTGNTASASGSATATIANVQYRGEWVFSRSGGGFALATGNVGLATATSTAAIVPAQGRGLVTMRADSGDFIRCVFDFNDWSSTGIGECLRNDGRQFDLTIRK